MKRVVYDTGALIAVDRDDDRMKSLHQRLSVRGIDGYIPTPVIAQAWRGGWRQARLARFISACKAVDLDEKTARDAGVLYGRAKTADVVDATVVILALRWDAAVVTSDPGDLTRLIDAVGAGLDVHVV